MQKKKKKREARKGRTGGRLWGVYSKKRHQFRVDDLPGGKRR